MGRSSDLQSVYAGIDAGGTTFKCGLFNDRAEIIAKQRIPVTTPEETFENCIAFFRAAIKDETQRLESFGIASFGPIDIDPASDSYGTILRTPKAGWSHTSITDKFASAFQLPVFVDTDVNGALLAELTLGNASESRTAAYVTIGTGIGAGIWANNGFIGQPSHPEFGHIAVKRHENDLDAQSVCPFHDDCLEGLASAASVQARYGKPETLPASHPAWDVEAYYLAQACRTLYLSLRTDRIVLGGGLMLAQGLLSKVRASFSDQLSRYANGDPDFADTMIVTPGLGDDAGVTGAMLVGRRGYDQKERRI